MATNVEPFATMCYITLGDVKHTPLILLVKLIQLFPACSVEGSNKHTFQARLPQKERTQRVQKRTSNRKWFS
eukprot:5258839-Amphidinium_carterae.1